MTQMQSYVWLRPKLAKKIKSGIFYVHHIVPDMAVAAVYICTEDAVYIPGIEM